MFKFSTKTESNRKLKMLDVLKQIKADKDIKVDAMKINSIVLINSINASTINSQSSDTFKEIYIFKINLNKKEIPKLFLEALDKSIKLHTYFIFEYEGLVYSTMCYKEIGNTVKLGKYYFHDFEKYKETDLPMINSVADVYKVLYSYEVRIPYRENETPDEYLKRVNMIHKLEFQISKTEAAIIHQVQPKKKYEYHTRLQEYKKEYEDLSKTED